MASFRWVLQLHKDVPRAARFYSEGLDFSVNVCTLRWAELQSGPLKLALMQSSSDIVMQKGYSSLLSFTVTDINSTVTKLMELGAELDGSIKHEVHGKVEIVREVFPPREQYPNWLLHVPTREQSTSYQYIKTNEGEVCFLEPPSLKKDWIGVNICSSSTFDIQQILS